jgi:hypothetical protein
MLETRAYGFTYTLLLSSQWSYLRIAFALSWEHQASLPISVRSIRQNNIVYGNVEPALTKKETFQGETKQ